MCVCVCVAYLEFLNEILDNSLKSLVGSKQTNTNTYKRAWMCVNTSVSLSLSRQHTLPLSLSLSLSSLSLFSLSLSLSLSLSHLSLISSLLPTANVLDGKGNFLAKRALIQLHLYRQ